MKLFKSDSQLIAEIHHEFDTAQDRLLDQSEKLLAGLNIPTESSIEKQAERLKGIGFIKTPTVSKAESLKESRELNKRKVVETKEQAETIRYYKQAYPFLKFITDDELNRICDKYKLIHAPVANYIKEVPEKNIKDIEKAQALKEKDKTVDMGRLFVTEYWPDVSNKIKEFMKDGLVCSGDFKEADVAVEKAVVDYLQRKGFNHRGYLYKKANIVKIDRTGLFIAAPESHFDLKGLSKKSKHGFFNIMTKEVKDPIVFRYVNGGCQILTMWGLEAEDPMLVNPINN